MATSKDPFCGKAREYDALGRRTQNATKVAQGILKAIPFSKEMEIMDFGAGTGLLLSEIAPYVGKITAIDVSKSMTDVLREKTIACDIEVIEMDLTTTPLNKQFNSIISSMTFHHIADIKNLLKTFYKLLKPAGTIAIADLEKEDGSFHTTDTGVYHYGFDKETLKNLTKDTGFQNINIQTINTIEKPTGNYPIFLLTAEKTS